MTLKISFNIFNPSSWLYCILILDYLFFRWNVIFSNTLIYFKIICRINCIWLNSNVPLMITHEVWGIMIDIDASSDQNHFKIFPSLFPNTKWLPYVFELHLYQLFKLNYLIYWCAIFLEEGQLCKSNVHNDYHYY